MPKFLRDGLVASAVAVVVLLPLGMGGAAISNGTISNFFISVVVPIFFVAIVTGFPSGVIAGRLISGIKAPIIGGFLAVGFWIIYILFV